jgi:phage baseplate assembly protein W
MSRSDKITIENKKTEYYSDFLNDFSKNPLTGYLSRITNEESIKQSIRNIIMTRKGERFFNPSFGSTIYSSLFNPNDLTTVISIRQSVIESINNFEPRAELIDVIVNPEFDTNHIPVKIIFSIRNFQNEQFELDLIISRVR